MSEGGVTEVASPSGLTDVDLAALLGADVAGVRRAADARIIPGWCIGGRWRFRERDIRRWLDAQIDPDAARRLCKELSASNGETDAFDLDSSLLWAMPGHGL